MKILVVDDHALFREGLVSLLSKQPDFTVIGEAASGHEAIAKANRLNPDIVLMDIGLPDMDGLEAGKAILAHTPDTKIVMLTIHDTDDLLVNAIIYGAKGYLLKDSSLSMILASLRALNRGEVALSRTMTRRVLDGFTHMKFTRTREPDMLENLTARELEVFRLLATKATNRQIAEQLSITETTVKVHVHNIFEKLDIKRRREAIKLFQQIEPGVPSSIPDPERRTINSRPEHQ